MSQLNHLYETFQPQNYNLSLEINNEEKAFSGAVSITGSLQPGKTALGLHAKDLDIISAAIDGKPANIEPGQDDELWIKQDGLTEGEHLVEIDFSGKITDAMHGMYPCKYRVDEKVEEIIATQFESHHAREVFPCVDEPQAKATFDLKLTTQTDVTVLSNQPILSQLIKNNVLVTEFDTTPRMSTYLLAWVVGKLHRKSAKTTSGVEVNVWATPAQSAASLDFALEHAVKSIEFFDEYFKTPYPLAKSDHVALPDFSSGAMENWGLITYREVALLADPKTTTISSKQYIATVVSHELSHQWFGNLVTMKWWNNLWLNESFATLMEYVAVDAIHPEWNAWLDFSTQESIMALRRDAIDGVQAVQVDVNHPDEISSLFDGAIVYAKGARLMRMCQSFIGHDAFQKGLQSYFAEFAYSNTEADDLWRHLSEASGKDISQFMNTWISQSGYPVVTVDDSGLRQDQFFIGPHQPSNKVWPIPLGAENSEDMPAVLETAVLNMPVPTDERLNVGDTAHFITNYSEDRLLAIVKREDLSELDKLQLIHEQLLLVRGGKAKSESLLELVERFKAQDSEHVWEMIAGSMAELRKFVESDELAEEGLRRLYGNIARDQFARLGWTMNSGEPESDTKLRSTILSMMIYSKDADVLKKVDELYLGGIDSIDPEIRPLVISSVVNRSEEANLIKELVATYQNTQSADIQNDLAIGISSVKNPEHVRYVIEQLSKTDVIRTQDTAKWFVYLIRNRYSRELAWDWMQNNWNWIESTFSGDKSYDYFPRYAASGLNDPKQRDEFVKFFEPLRDEPSLTRTIDLGVIEIDARLELLKRDGESVRSRLKQI